MLTVETRANETGGGGGEAITNYEGPFVRKGAQDPTVFFVFLGSYIICRLTH